MSFKSRHLLAALLAAALPVAAHAAEPREVRLDYAYYAPTSLVLKDQGILEKRLAADGISVKWVFSQGSNRSLEYLNGGIGLPRAAASTSLPPPALPQCSAAPTAAR